ncbi:MAG: hypothetical protein ACLFVZ_08555, partial [Actinomycetota bacterium]
MESTRSRSAISGALAAGVALGVSELIAALIAAAPSLVESLGNWVIDNVPRAIKEWAIATFGTADKPILLASIIVVTVLVGAGVGIYSRRRFGLAVAVFSVFGLVAALAGGADPQVGMGIAVIPAGAAVIVGLATLRMLYGTSDPGTEEATQPTRRAFLLGAGAFWPWRCWQARPVDISSSGPSAPSPAASRCRTSRST